MCEIKLLARHLFSPKYLPMINLIRVFMFMRYSCGASISCRFLYKNC